MDDEHPEVIRQQMEETRSQLSEKLEILETQLTDTVQSTTSAVTDTVDAVKETVATVTDSVQETVHNVGELLDIQLQTERHPWIVFGGSIAVGYLASGFLFEQRRAPAPVFVVDPTQAPSAVAQAAAPVAPRETWLGQQLRTLRGIAIAALMDAVRDVATKGFPRPVVRPPEGTPEPDAHTAPFRANVAGKRTA